MDLMNRAGYWAWILFIIFTMLLAPFPQQWLLRHVDIGIFGPAAATATVDASGFTLSLGGVTISGDASVAPAGTEIRAERFESDLPSEVDEFAYPVGNGVEITLGDDIQPASPITITFSQGDVAGWYAESLGNSDLVPVVFASSDNQHGFEFADAQLTPTGTVVVVTDHLSSFYPGVASARRFSDRLEDEISVGMGVRSDAPSCYLSGNVEAEWTFSYIQDELIWPCARQDGDDLEVSLTNNSGEVWIVSSQSSSRATPTTLSFPGILLAVIAHASGNPATTAPLVPPDGNATFTIATPPDEIVFNVKLNYGLTAINAVVSSSLSFLPPGKVERIIKRIGAAECLVGVIQEASGGDVKIDGSFMRTVMQCMGLMIEGLTGSLFSSVTIVPGAFVTMFTSTHRSLAGSDQFSFTVTRNDDFSDAESGTSTWPTGRNDAPPRLMVWLGANMYAYPDWVACDDPRDWCLVGNDGEQHLLVKMDGLEPMYWLDDTIPDPREALLSTGLSEETVDQILGD